MYVKKKKIESKVKLERIKSIIEKYNEIGLAISVKNLTKEYNNLYLDDTLTQSNCSYYLKKYLDNKPNKLNKKEIVKDLLISIIDKYKQTKKYITINRLYDEVSTIYGENYIDKFSLSNIYKEIKKEPKIIDKNDLRRKEISLELSILHNGLTNLLNKEINNESDIKKINNSLNELDCNLLDNSIKELESLKKEFDFKTNEIKKNLNKIETTIDSIEIEDTKEDKENDNVIFFLGLNVVFLCLFFLVFKFYEINYLKDDIQFKPKVIVEKIILTD